MWPLNANNVSNYAAYLLACDDWESADELAAVAWQLLVDPPELRRTLPHIEPWEFHSVEQEDQLDSSEAWARFFGGRSQVGAEIMFTRAVAATLGRSDRNPALQRLKTLFKCGFRRFPWSFDKILELVEKKELNDMQLYRNLANAILKPKEEGNLEQFKAWKEIEAVTTLCAPHATVGMTQWRQIDLVETGQLSTDDRASCGRGSPVGGAASNR